MGAALLGSSGSAAAASSPDPSEWHFHRDHILGTSLDLGFVAPNREVAELAEAEALGELECIRLAFSLHDPNSELSQLNRSSSARPLTAEMFLALLEAKRWFQWTGGAYNARVGAIHKLWVKAEQCGTLPDPHSLSALASEIASPGWHIDEEKMTVRRLGEQTLDLNAFAKGYAIHRAARVVKERVPEVRAGLINLGGDMIGWGKTWPIGIQNPATPADNAPPLGGVALYDGAIATSGGYQRIFTIDSIRYSHLLDPRTGRPAEGIASATVLAPYSVLANMLATSLCVIHPEAGLQLVASLPDTSCLIVTASGMRISSPGFPLLPAQRMMQVVQDGKPEDKKPKADAWPEGFQVSVALELPKVGAGRYRRPYTALWVENAEGKAVRTLAVWGNAPKYLKDLNDWWKIGKDDKDLIKAVTRATRGPGKYDLAWDGRDDKGNALGQGTYTIRIEVTREFGQHLRQSGKIECKANPTSVKVAMNAETGETVIEYGMKKS